MALSLDPRAIRRLAWIGVAPWMAALCSGLWPHAARADCRLEPFATGQVTSVVDGADFILDDGREVHLAAIEVPLPRTGVDAARNAASLAAKAALEALLMGQTVALEKLGGGTDRYGRLLAYAVVNRDGIEIAVQPAMLAQGHARLGARIGKPDCTAALRAAEATARRGKLGLWGDPSYQMRQADKPAEILADRGRFSVVEGRALSVRTSGATIYVNFGRLWSRDFTVAVARRNERAFKAAGLALKGLEGRTIRVRGWVEQRGGPRIEAVDPDQIEIADGKVE
jgi:endonuclease YncB( thermonuclease family)